MCRFHPDRPGEVQLPVGHGVRRVLPLGTQHEQLLDVPLSLRPGGFQRAGLLSVVSGAPEEWYRRHRATNLRTGSQGNLDPLDSESPRLVCVRDRGRGRDGGMTQ